MQYIYIHMFITLLRLYMYVCIYNSAYIIDAVSCACTEGGKSIWGVAEVVSCDQSLSEHGAGTQGGRLGAAGRLGTIEIGRRSTLRSLTHRKTGPLMSSNCFLFFLIIHP